MRAAQQNTIAPGYRELPLNRLIESPHNPRRRFNEQSLAELAASMEVHGVLTPLLVRPLDSDFEIAAGHRRFRAARMAGFVTVPAVVRLMTDQEFMEVLAVENLQREDVHTYEEAQGYAELLKLPGYDVVAVSGKIGRSEGYVRSRLRLLSLTEEVAEAFLSDRITFAHARLIAPLPADKQAEALEECFELWNGNQRLIPVSEMRDWIQGSEGETLSRAPFAIDDAELIPAAGACLTCPKSTCGEGKLFADDDGEETCYDKKCFDAKIEAKIERHRSSGLVEISTAWDHSKKDAGVLRRDEFTEVEVPEAKDAPPSLDPEEDEEPEPEQQACAFLEDAVIVAGHDRGKTTQICRNDDCPVHGSAKQPAAARGSNATHDDWQEKRKADEAKKKAAWAKRRELYKAICSKWAPLFDRATLFLLVISGLNAIHHRELLGEIAVSMGLKKEADLSAQKAVFYTRAEKADILWLRGAFIQLFFAEHIEREEWDRNYDLLTIAEDWLSEELADPRAASVAKAREKQAAPAKPAKKKAKV